MENVNKILDVINLKSFDDAEESVDEKAERIEEARKKFFEKLKFIGIPPRFINARLKDFEGVKFNLIDTKIVDDEVVKSIKEIDTNDLLRALDKGFSIKFIGESGRGKTHLAIALIIEMVKLKKTVSFLNDFEFRAISKKMFADKAYDPYVEYGRKKDIQLIDDLGSIIPDLATKPDSIMREIAMGIISERYNQMRQTIITSNFDLRKKLEVSSLSRLKQDWIEVEMIGDDKRIFK